MYKIRYVKYSEHGAIIIIIVVVVIIVTLYIICTEDSAQYPLIQHERNTRRDSLPDNAVTAANQRKNQSSLTVLFLAKRLRVNQVPG